MTPPSCTIASANATIGGFGKRLLENRWTNRADSKRFESIGIHDTFQWKCGLPILIKRVREGWGVLSSDGLTFLAEFPGLQGNRLEVANFMVRIGLCGSPAPTKRLLDASIRQAEHTVAGPSNHGPTAAVS
jgi:hypothetical protein